MPDRPAEVTRLLQALARGEDAAAALFETVYDELRGIAGARMGRERPGGMLQATALVHEAYLRLVGQEEMAWESRRHFFGAAAKAMERLLIDQARGIRSQKRGGAQAHVTLTVDGLPIGEHPERALELHEALAVLAEEDARAAEVARMRFFVGLDVDDTAQALEVSPRTVARDWAFARARLIQLLPNEDPATE